MPLGAQPGLKIPFHVCMMAHAHTHTLARTRSFTLPHAPKSQVARRLISRSLEDSRRGGFALGRLAERLGVGKQLTGAHRAHADARLLHLVVDRLLKDNGKVCDRVHLCLVLLAVFVLSGCNLPDYGVVLFFRWSFIFFS